MFVRKPNGYLIARLSFYVRVVTKDMKKFTIVYREPVYSRGAFIRNTKESIEGLSKNGVVEALESKVSSRFHSCKAVKFEEVEPKFRIINGIGEYRDIKVDLTSKGKIIINGTEFKKGNRDIEAEILTCIQPFSPHVPGARQLIKIFEKGLVGWQ